MRANAMLTLVAVGLVSGSCAPAADQAEPPSAAESEMSRAEATEVFEAFVEGFDAAMNSGDVDALMAGFTADPVSMPPDAPTVEGAAAVRGLWSDLIAQEPTVDNVLQGFRVDGDLAVLWGSYSLTVGDVETVGKWIAVSERQADGSWKTLRNMWSTDAPAEM